MRRELPPGYFEKPPDMAAAAFYMRAWRDLSTCRDLGMGIGRIPWSAVHAYAAHLGLDAANERVFNEVIVAMDAVYLRYESEQQKRRAEHRKQPQGGRSARTRRPK